MDLGRAMERSTRLLFLLLLMAGCRGTQETQYLKITPRPAQAEIQSYNIHDPFPDEDAGPNTFTRPRAFMVPRTDTRKDYDLRYLKAAYGFPQQRYALFNNPTGGTAQYPVQPLWRTPQDAAPIAAAQTWQP